MILSDIARRIAGRC